MGGKKNKKERAEGNIESCLFYDIWPGIARKRNHKAGSTAPPPAAD
jgi:hypothetical protein